MPIPSIRRVNPIDLQQNIAVGISLPFGNSENTRLFNSTYSTIIQAKSNLINLLLTSKGERVMNPEFGCDLRKLLFEPMDDDLKESIIETITYNVGIFVPQVKIDKVDVIFQHDTNLSVVSIDYSMKISGASDNVTVEFV